MSVPSFSAASLAVIVITLAPCFNPAVHTKVVVPEQEHVPPLSLDQVTSVTPTASLDVPFIVNDLLVVLDGSD